MTHDASLQCQSCQRRFVAQLQVGRAALARSGMVFLSEQCSHCRASHTYMRDDYRFDVPMGAPAALTA